MCGNYESKYSKIPLFPKNMNASVTMWVEQHKGTCFRCDQCRRDVMDVSENRDFQHTCVWMMKGSWTALDNATPPLGREN